MHAGRGGGVDLVATEMGEQLLERHPGLESGQRGAEAVVDPGTEGEVAGRGPTHVEVVGPLRNPDGPLGGGALEQMKI